MAGSTKQRRMRVVERWLLNPLPRFLLQLGLAPKAFALLETVGRRSGLPRHTPVGGHLDGNTYWLVSEHGEGSSYARNLLANPAVRIKVGRGWRSGTATLLPGDDGFARRRDIDRANGIIGRLDGLLFKLGATRPATIRIDLEPDRRAPRPQ